MRNRKTRTELKTVPPVLALVQLDAATVDTEAMTVEVVFYTGAPVIRMPMFDDPFELEFEMSKKAADLSRLNNGAPLVDSHQTDGSVRDSFGVVKKAWLSGGEGRALVQFSKRPEVAGIWQDVQDGILKNISMGVLIQELKDVTAKDAELTRMRATKWQPRELSLVLVPADPGAQILAEDGAEGRTCKIIHRAEAAAEAPTKGTKMETITVRLLADTDIAKQGALVEILADDFDEELHTKDLKPKRVTPADPGPVVPAPSGETNSRTIDEALAADKAYGKEIRRIGSHYGMDELWAQKKINEQVEVKDAISAATTERAKRNPIGNGAIGFGEDFDSSEFKSESMSESLIARATGTELPERSRQFANWSFAECALELLKIGGKARNLSVRGDVAQILSTNLALHTTSDFPLLLANTLNKMLQPEYAQAEPTYRFLAERRPFNDFRPHSFDSAGDFPNLLQVNEHGEFKSGTMGEKSESVTAATYGRIIGLSRQLLVNDDLGAFSNLAVKAARRVVDFENALFFSTVITAGAGLGPDLSDTNPVYDAAHNNLTGAGVLSVTLLGAARALMMKQTSIDGLKLNTPAAILLVSPDSLTLAEQLLAPGSALVGQGKDDDAVSNVNPFAGAMRPVGDANLTGSRFYMLADPARLANYMYGYLNGATGPRTEVRNGFETDGVEFKLALDFGVGAIEFRGGVSGAGA